MSAAQPAKLALENGLVFTGQAFGARGESDGEVVFNTSMTGYQEILTDPSYRGQIVVMTYPQIGNYGVNADDNESERPHLAGFVVRELSRLHSNYRSTGDLDQFLAEHGIVAIEGIDTRKIVRSIRSQGAMKGILSTTDLDDDRLVEKARSSPGLIGRDLVREVLPVKARSWTAPLSSWDQLGAAIERRQPRPKVVALDFGMKWNIARHLFEIGCDVMVLPGSATSQEILEHSPDGVFLSNGPGDPEPIDYAIRTIAELLPQVPIFGICLGHQLLGLACGAKTFKLKFGHRGANQPVLHLTSGKIEITSQNHGFAVDEDTLPAELEITHRNLNDNTIAGMRHRRHNAFGVQYHPEASAGPHDSRYLFEQFMQRMASTAAT